MNLYNHNANRKRRLSKSKDEENLKRKNNEVTGCFKRCYTRKKHEIASTKKEKILKTSIAKIPLEDENINLSSKASLSIQTGSIEKIANTLMTHLKRSPLYHESIFCEKVSKSYCDSCIECTVQHGPDTWENIPKNLSKQLYDNNKLMSIERLDTFLNKRIKNDDFGSSSTSEIVHSLRNNVNSYINDIIGDGVDRIFEIITTTSTNCDRQKELKADNKLSAHSGYNIHQNILKRSPSDLDKRQQNYDFIKQQSEHQGLIFEKQNSKKTSQMSHYSSINRSLDNASSRIISDDYNWNLKPNETSLDHQRVLDTRSSSEVQEPYNWDEQEYQWSSPLDSSQKTQLVDKFINNQSKQSLMSDNDILLSNDDHSYSIASVLPPNKRKRVESHSNDLKNLNPSLNTLNQGPTFSTLGFSRSADKISDHQNKSKHSQEKIDSNESKDLSYINSNQQPKSFLILSEGKDLLPTVNSTQSTKVNYDTFQVKNSPNIDANNGIPTASIHNETREQNDRLSATSVSDLFKKITDAKKQKSLDLDSISTVYSIPSSVCPSVSPDVTIDKDDKNHDQLSQTTLTKKGHSVPLNNESKQSKSYITMDSNDQSRLINVDLPTKRTLSHLIDEQECQPSETEINNAFNRVHSTYDDIMNSWRHLLERLLSFLLPSIRNTNHNINLSPSITTSNAHSWSTLIPSGTLDMTQSDTIGPWWGRRDAYDRTPATSIFANESLSASYSIETITSNKQMCIPIENMPCCFKYHRSPNTFHCCCSSPITINNSSSSS